MEGMSEKEEEICRKWKQNCQEHRIKLGLTVAYPTPDCRNNGCLKDCPNYKDNNV